MAQEGTSRDRSLSMFILLLIGLAASLPIIYQLWHLQHLSVAELRWFDAESSGIMEGLAYLDSFTAGLPLFIPFAALTALVIIIACMAVYQKHIWLFGIAAFMILAGFQLFGYYKLTLCDLPTEYIIGLVPLQTTIFAYIFLLGVCGWDLMRNIRFGLRFIVLFLLMSLPVVMCILCIREFLDLLTVKPGDLWMSDQPVFLEAGIPVYWVWVWADYVGFLLAALFLILFTVVMLNIYHSKTSTIRKPVTPESFTEILQKMNSVGIIIGSIQIMILLFFLMPHIFRYFRSGDMMSYTYMLYLRHIIAGGLGAVIALLLTLKLFYRREKSISTNTLASALIIGGTLGLVLIEYLFYTGRYGLTSVPRAKLSGWSFLMMLAWLAVVLYTCVVTYYRAYRQMYGRE